MSEPDSSAWFLFLGVLLCIASSIGIIGGIWYFVEQLIRHGAN